MSRFDQWFEGVSRESARRLSRRSWISRFGAVLVGGAAMPLLPVARATERAASPDGIAGPEGDPTHCDYWRHCAIDGFPCSCCGGTQSTCPPGTTMSPVAWIGTCRNPKDGQHYIISYNDCCGRTMCGRCLCNRNEGERPLYHWYRNNDLNWCAGAKQQTVSCSTALVVRVAEERQPEK